MAAAATEQQTKRKRDSQAAKNSTGNKKVRFLNMDPKQVHRRYKRMKQREYRKALLQSKPRRPPSKAAATKPVVRKARPCCGYLPSNCFCKPPPGMQKSHLTALCRRFTKTALSSVQDTTDVSTFRHSWPCAVRPYRFGYFWRTRTHMLCSIKTTCCTASLRRRRSYSGRRGLTGDCYRALSRSLSRKVNDGARRITESQLFERSGCRVTSEKHVCYRATMVLSGPFWRADS